MALGTTILSEAVTTRSPILGDNCKNLGRTCGSFFWRYKVLASYDQKKGWDFVTLNPLQRLARRLFSCLGCYASTHLDHVISHYQQSVVAQDADISKRFQVIYDKQHPGVRLASPDGPLAPLDEPLSTEPSPIVVGNEHQQQHQNVTAPQQQQASSIQETQQQQVSTIKKVIHIVSSSSTQTADVKKFTDKVKDELKNRKIENNFEIIEHPEGYYPKIKQKDCYNSKQKENIDFVFMIHGMGEDRPLWNERLKDLRDRILAVSSKKDLPMAYVLMQVCEITQGAFSSYDQGVNYNTPLPRTNSGSAKNYRIPIFLLNRKNPSPISMEKNEDIQKGQDAEFNLLIEDLKSRTI